MQYYPCLTHGMLSHEDANNVFRILLSAEADVNQAQATPPLFWPGLDPRFLFQVQGPCCFTVVLHNNNAGDDVCGLRYPTHQSWVLNWNLGSRICFCSVPNTVVGMEMSELTGIQIWFHFLPSHLCFYYLSTHSPCCCTDNRILSVWSLMCPSSLELPAAVHPSIQKGQPHAVPVRRR